MFLEFDRRGKKVLEQNFLLATPTRLHHKVINKNWINVPTPKLQFQMS